MDKEIEIFVKLVQQQNELIKEIKLLTNELEKVQKEIELKLDILDKKAARKWNKDTSIR